MTLFRLQNNWNDINKLYNDIYRHSIAYSHDRNSSKIFFSQTGTNQMCSMNVDDLESIESNDNLANNIARFFGHSVVPQYQYKNLKFRGEF